MKAVGEIEKLWIFDYDGTLSPLVANRSEATLHPSCRDLLEDLVAVPRYCAAVLSSRLLGDLAVRVPIRGVILGGSSGMEWRLPGGEEINTGRHLLEELNRRRNMILPKVKCIAAIPGVEIEDKKWSLAVHVRKASPNSKKYVYLLLEDWTPLRGLRKFKGPEVVELQLLQEMDKSHGVRKLCDILKLEPADGKLIYAGDDENDAAAMQWVMHLNGIVFTVGKKPLVPGSRVVDGPLSLGRDIRKLAALQLPDETKKSRGGCRTG